MNEWLPKSWLFEVYDVQSSTIVESFTLILPPQSHSQKEPQRVSITKTFDDSFIDDYGPDNRQITIRGFSGTAHAFPTYQTTSPSSNRFTNAVQATGSSVGYTQQEAFIAFRNKIMRYKEGTSFENLALRVYNLHDEEAYEVTLLDFTLDRTADSPWRYPFTILLFVNKDILSPKVAKVESVFTPIDLKAWDSAATDLDSKLDDVSTLMEKIAAVQTAILRIREAITAIRNKVTIVANYALTFAQIPLWAVRQLVDELSVINRNAASLYTQGVLTINQYANLSSYMQSAIDTNLRLWGAAIQSNRQGLQAVNGPPKSVLPPPVTSVNILAANAELLASVDSEQSQLTFNSFIPYTVQGNETLQDIALKTLGDSALWDYIAQINGLSSNSSVVGGMLIVLPSIASVDSANLNIVRRDVQDDPLGIDIYINENGNMSVESDIRTVEGKANVIQALNNRISTPLGHNIKDVAYGLSSNIGKAGDILARKYIRMSVIAALLSEPRVRSVETVDVQPTADVIQVAYSVSLVSVDQKVASTVSLL